MPAQAAKAKPSRSRSPGRARGKSPGRPQKDDAQENKRKSSPSPKIENGTRRSSARILEQSLRAKDGKAANDGKLDAAAERRVAVWKKVSYEEYGLLVSLPPTPLLSVT
jgi:hypothetical protein